MSDSGAEAMDETMDAILCAMDTTISNSQCSQAIKPQKRKKEQSLLDQFELDFDRIIQTYNEEERSNWFKDKLLLLWKEKANEIM